MVNARAAIINRETQASITPEQIAEALQTLARQDQVGIYLDSHKGHIPCFLVVDSRIKTGTAFDVEQRSGASTSYAEALEKCRAANFGEGIK